MHTYFLSGGWNRNKKRLDFENKNTYRLGSSPCDLQNPILLYHLKVPMLFLLTWHGFCVWIIVPWTHKHLTSLITVSKFSTSSQSSPHSGVFSFVMLRHIVIVVQSGHPSATLCLVTDSSNCLCDIVHSKIEAVLQPLPSPWVCSWGKLGWNMYLYCSVYIQNYTLDGNQASQQFSVICHSPNKQKQNSVQNLTPKRSIAAKWQNGAERHSKD